MTLVKAKINQAIEILNELDIDLWLVFVRETDMMSDPVVPLVVGHNVVWQSAFFYARDGRALALVGNFDTPDFERSGHFEKVQPYIKDCGKEIKSTIDKFKPRKIALNYSTNDIAADGLTHGMYLLLCEYLKGTPYPKRFVSSEAIMSRLRGRKVPEEIALIKDAAVLTHKVWEQTLTKIKPGQSEIAIRDIIDGLIVEHGGVPSFNTIVNAGAKSSPGHGRPGQAVLEPGDLLHIDFGIRKNDYCSDIQRLAYVRRPGEPNPPENLTKAFAMVRKVIEITSLLYKPGKKGFQIDAVARKLLRDNGYPVYQHALGHQIGRSVHDGAAIVGPKWKRYGLMPEIPLEQDNTFTVELGIELPDIGYVGLEEDLVVTANGGEFLCPVQKELAFI